MLRSGRRAARLGSGLRSTRAVNPQS
jgi:hypothetical protein